MSLEKIGKWIDENWQEFSLVIITFLYCLVSILFKINKKVLWGRIESQKLGWIIAILTLIFASYVTYKLIEKKTKISDLDKTIHAKSDKIQVLENNVDELISQQSKFFSILIKAIFYKLQFNANERISIYKFETDKFVLIGRYSSNPEYNKTRRKEYDQDQGFINSAWINEDGKLFVPELPNFETAKKSYYKEISEVSHIDEEVFEQIRMKSRSYYCKSISSHDDMNRLAVMVFESVSTEKIEPESIEQVLNEHEGVIISLMENVNNTSRNNNMASKMGF